MPSPPASGYSPGIIGTRTANGQTWKLPACQAFTTQARPPGRTESSGNAFPASAGLIIIWRGSNSRHRTVQSRAVSARMWFEAGTRLATTSRRISHRKKDFAPGIVPSKGSCCPGIALQRDHRTRNRPARRGLRQKPRYGKDIPPETSLRKGHSAKNLGVERTLCQEVSGRMMHVTPS